VRFSPQHHHTPFTEGKGNRIESRGSGSISKVTIWYDVVVISCNDYDQHLTSRNGSIEAMRNTSVEYKYRLSWRGIDGAMHPTVAHQSFESIVEVPR
jgi:hypothetical protein